MILYTLIVKEANNGSSICKTPVNVKHYGLWPSRLALVYIETADKSAVYLDTMCPLSKS